MEDKIESPNGCWSPDNHRFMHLAMEQANLALESLEVPVGCVIIEDGIVVAAGRNRTTETRNSTRHAEIEAIDTLILKWKMEGISGHKAAENFRKCILYVTCEPCIMCADALSILGFKEVYYGCANEKFGGCGSVLPLHKGNPSSNKKGFVSFGGIMASEAVSLFQRFYEQGNPNAPKPHRVVDQQE